MTGPFPQLPSIEQGNLASDIGSAVSTFAKGLQEERARRRDDAMKQAMLMLKMKEFQNPKPMHIVASTPEGLKHAFTNPRDLSTQITDIAAPENQYFFPTEDDSGALGMAGVPRQRPVGSVPAQQVPMQPGQQPRDVAPAIQAVETPQGQQVYRVPRREGAASPVPGPGGSVLAPKAAETDLRRARDAFEMIQSKYEMGRAIQQNPRAYDEVAKYMATLDIGEGVPLTGDLLKAITNNAQSVLSPAAAQYFSSFMNFAQARAFSRGGATLTRNEIDYALGSLAPRPFEDPQTTAMRERLIHGIISGAIAGNQAWQRYREAAKQFGWNDEGTMMNLQAPNVQTPQQSRYGYRKPTQ